MRHLYAVGTNPKTHPLLVVMAPTPRGWRARSTDRAYDHEYMHGERDDALRDWLRIDFDHVRILPDRASAVQHLLSENIEEHHGRFLLPPPAAGPVFEEVDAVLRHLECGW